MGGGIFQDFRHFIFNTNLTKTKMLKNQIDADKLFARWSVAVKTMNHPPKRVVWMSLTTQTAPLPAWSPPAHAIVDKLPHLLSTIQRPKAKKAFSPPRKPMEQGTEVCSNLE